MLIRLPGPPLSACKNKGDGRHGAAWFLQQVALLQCGPVSGPWAAPHWTEAAQFPALQIGRSDLIIPESNASSATKSSGNV